MPPKRGNAESAAPSFFIPFFGGDLMTLEELEALLETIPKDTPKNRARRAIITRRILELLKRRAEDGNG